MKRLGLTPVSIAATLFVVTPLQARRSDLLALFDLNGDGKLEGDERVAIQGPLALELIKQVPDLDSMLCPIGGGLLIAGVSIAVKALKPKNKVIGVERAHTGNFAAALRPGKPVIVKRRATLADGLAPLIVAPASFALARTRVDQAVSVAEPWIALAFLRLLELEKPFVEGSAAAPLAALMAGNRPALQGKRVALILRGGNIDP